jgi:hypothetical protein
MSFAEIFLNKDDFNDYFVGTTQVHYFNIEDDFLVILLFEIRIQKQ